MTPGDIVRHADYPQWGHGYVIRAKRGSLDVFFRWGGKRKVGTGEPLERGRSSGVEAELFATFLAHAVLRLRRLERQNARQITRYGSVRRKVRLTGPR